MRSFRSRLCSAVLVPAVLFALPGPVLPRAQAQAGGALVLGLDQEPPTLDPHASPSAVTYQIIASVTEDSRNKLRFHLCSQRRRVLRKPKWSL